MKSADVAGGKRIGGAIRNSDRRLERPVGLAARKALGRHVRIGRLALLSCQQLSVRTLSVFTISSCLSRSRTADAEKPE